MRADFCVQFLQTIIIDGKEYEKYRAFIDHKKYLVISSNSKKILTDLEQFKAMPISPRLPQKKNDEVPNTLQWGARHPFQGGSFNGK
jgi:hypothetical protein